MLVVLWPCGEPLWCPSGGWIMAVVGEFWIISEVMCAGWISGSNRWAPVLRLAAALGVLLLALVLTSEEMAEA